MSVEDDVQRAKKLLETVIHASGLTRREMDKRLGAGPGYVSQVLTGRMELKYKHILAILDALEIDAAVFFQTLFPEVEPVSGQGVVEEFMRRLHKLGFGPRPPTSLPSPAVDAQDLERLVENAVRAALTDQADRANQAERAERADQDGRRPGDTHPGNSGGG